LNFIGLKKKYTKISTKVQESIMDFSGIMDLLVFFEYIKSLWNFPWEELFLFQGGIKWEPAVDCIGNFMPKYLWAAVVL
jgi:hypothetical protein